MAMSRVSYVTTASPPSLRVAAHTVPSRSRVPTRAFRDRVRERSFDVRTRERRESRRPRERVRSGVDASSSGGTSAPGTSIRGVRVRGTSFRGRGASVRGMSVRGNSGSEAPASSTTEFAVADVSVGIESDRGSASARRGTLRLDDGRRLSATTPFSEDESGVTMGLGKMRNMDLLASDGRRPSCSGYV